MRGKTQQAPFVAALNLRRSSGHSQCTRHRARSGGRQPAAVGLCRHRLDRQSSRRNRLEGRMPHRERSSLRAHQVTQAAPRVSGAPFVRSSTAMMALHSVTDDVLHAARMKTLLIVFHSLTGGTRQMAEAAAHSAYLGPECASSFARPRSRTWDVLIADGSIFATPENLASIAGLMKDFFDRTYYAALERINGRPYATLICAGSDGQNAARQITRIATGWQAAADRLTADRVHPRPDTRGNPGTQGDRPRRSRTLWRTRSRARDRHGDGDLLIERGGQRRNSDLESFHFRTEHLSAQCRNVSQRAK